jgi:hypothetical protein
VLRERRIPARLKNLKHRLLNQAVEHARNAEAANRPGLRLRDLRNLSTPMRHSLV